jgi:hypothetical protein
LFRKVGLPQSDSPLRQPIHGFTAVWSTPGTFARLLLLAEGFAARNGGKVVECAQVLEP